MSSSTNPSNSRVALQRFRFPICLVFGFGLLIGAAGCADPDPTAEMRKYFWEMKQGTEKLDELLASVDSKERAEEVLPELRDQLKAIRTAGFELERRRKINRSRSAIPLLNEIEKFRQENKQRLPHMLVRLQKIEGVGEILVPVLQNFGEDPLPPLPPPPEGM